MSIGTALVAIKTANGTLNSLIGVKFYPDVLPQDVELPAVRFQEISRTTSDYTMSGRPQTATIRIQLDAYATSAALRTTLRAALNEAFLPDPRVSGAWGGETLFDIRPDGGGSMVEMLGTLAQAYRQRFDLICDCAWSTTL